MSGGKGAWERAASWVDERVNRAAGGTVEGVATTRLSLLVWWQLFVSVWLVLQLV